MTTERLFRILVRRWYVVLLGVLLTAPFAQHVREHQGLYWSQVDVLFVAPPTWREPNTIEANASGLTSVAGMVAAEINKSSDTPLTSSAGATLAGQGVTDGFLVRLPNSGGQWARNYDRPVLDVQVISPSVETTRARMLEVVDRIDETLRQLQADDHVRADNTITTISAPTASQVFRFGGNPTRAALVVVGLGAWVTVLMTVGFDMLVRRLRPHRRRAPERLETDRVTFGAGAA